jgi:hypothetical protein
MLELFYFFFILTEVIVTLTFLPSFTFVCLCLSHSLSFFFDRYKKRHAVCAYTLVALSHFVCSVLGGSVSLCALLIFLPPHRIRLCVCVCARFVLSLSAIDSLQTHTHTHTRARACAHTHTYRRWWEEGHTEEVGGRTSEREDHLLH